jgi:hypothetical protein
MANQLEPGTMGGSLPDNLAVNEANGGTAYPAFHGRAVSWVAVSIITVGFVIGGLALIFGHGGPTWWLFWTGSAVAVAGLLISFATNTFQDWY